MATRRNARGAKPAKRQPKREGEGSYEAAARYDENVEEFVEQSDLGGLAREAKEALEGDEGRKPRQDERRQKPSAPLTRR